MLNVLIVSEEAQELCSLFRLSGFAPDGADLQQKDLTAGGVPAVQSRYDIAFLDIDNEGWRERLLDLRQQMPVIAFSHPSIKAAIDAMKLGASDYLEKPLTSEALGEVISRYKKKVLTQKYGFDEIIGTSAVIQAVYGLIKRAAVSESNVLITGESGTGKELLARAIHRWSPRSERAFMTINCGAIPDTLLESELFGFEKGSFTGANYTKKGLLDQADGGTVFFDEIGDVSPLFQIKVLRVLQEGEIMRIGGARQIKVDVRIIAATNIDLKAACQKGLFREDLFYRLNVINIHVPPLRERMEDVPLLVGQFIKKHAVKRKDMVIKGISSEALGILMRNSFPGNIRELENIIEHAISFTGSPEILPSDLPSYMFEARVSTRAPIPRMRDAVIAFEKELIASALKNSGGNISRAATSLGIYRQQLQRKIKDLGIAI
ncbi:MAG: sigma-54-dependent Fis family transcriptional regulator [Nitrospirae bacterium]|nr:sigma-54-dependent Fis family transcriptional regulator [Nitrospirota bacterium]